MWAIMQFCLAGDVMDWIREWILQIAGVIILSAVCDVIMPDGAMKKYVKPILGFILIFTIIRPVTGVTTGKLSADALQETLYPTAEIIQTAEDVQRENILKLYEENIGKKFKDVIQTKYNLSACASVTTDKRSKAIGNISCIDIEIKSKEGVVVNTETIKRYIAEEFGAEEKNIKIILRGE